MPYEERRQLSQRLKDVRDSVATDVTTEFLGRHQDWVRRYGELAWTRGVEDAQFHVDFLAGAIQSGSLTVYEDYCRWTARVLDSRGIDTTYLVENLQQVRDRLARLLTGDQQQLAAAYVDAGCRAIIEGGPAAVERSAGPLDADVRLYVQAALDGQRQAALNITTEAIRRGVPIHDVYCDLLQEAQYEIGRLWERNVISVAREHMATAITQFVVAQLYSQLEFNDEPRGNILVTGVEGELHQLGANMLADVLEADGWNVRFLGTQLPHRDILRALDEHDAAVLGVSTTMLYNLPKVARLVEEARAARGADLRVVVGGGAFRASNNAWRDIGADATARDLRDAMAVVNQLSQSA